MAANDCPAPPRGLGLSGKLLVLTVLFVMIAVVVVYVPLVANVRESWLADRLGRARTAALVLDAAPDGMIPEPLARDTLAAIGARMVALKANGTRRLLAVSDVPAEVAVDVDLREPSWFGNLCDAFGTLVAPPGRLMRVVGQPPMAGEFVEIVIDEKPLKEAMLRFSATYLMVSLIISGITGALMFVALDRLIARPVRRLTGTMVAFGGAPESSATLLVPSRRGDEIGVAERELSRMQGEIQGLLSSKSRLAALGLAVSKINHDLRNLLASAQLVTDRLGAVADPTVQRLAPKLLSALDRAISFCEATLSYGRAQEPQPERRRVLLDAVVRDVRESLGLGEASAVAFVEAVERDLEVDADPDQLFRVLLNLARNAQQALVAKGDNDPARDQIRLTGRREGTVVIIELADTGPGLPEKAKIHLFEAFQGSTQRGGTGLGLAIAAELVRAHGGEIRHVEGTIGATFRISIPDRPIDFTRARAKRAG